MRGQYKAGVVEGKQVPAYVDEKARQATPKPSSRCAPTSTTGAGPAACRFYLRTGKRLPERRTQIVIQFKPLPHFIFGERAEEDVVANRLVIDLQPDEDISVAAA